MSWWGNLQVQQDRPRTAGGTTRSNLPLHVLVIKREGLTFAVPGGTRNRQEDNLNHSVTYNKAKARIHLLHAIFLLWIPIITEEEKPQLRKIIMPLKEKGSETTLAKNCVSVTSLSKF